MGPRITTIEQQSRILRKVDLAARIRELKEFAGNPCHDPSTGKFCETAGPGSDGGDQGKGQLEGYDIRGKPIAGTQAWLDAHGVSKKLFESRPYIPYSNTPEGIKAINVEYGGNVGNNRLFRRVASQSDGFLMKRNPVPESPDGPILAEARPNKNVSIDPSKRAYKQKIAENARQHADAVKNYTPKQAVAEQRKKVADLEQRVVEAKRATPKSIMKDAENRLAHAEANLREAKAGGDPATAQAAKKERDAAKRGLPKAEQRADDFVPGRDEFNAKRNLATAKEKLAAAEADPPAFLETLKKSSERNAVQAKKQFEKTEVKYIFPKGPEASRLDIHPDPTNVKNFVDGDGRVYWAMEGCIKADSILTSIKKEGETGASVVSNPSVTLWRNTETDWVAKKHLQGRDVILIPDADGEKNPAVRNEARSLQAALITKGVGRVVIAAPPLTKRGGIEAITLPSGAKDQRKGVDDHLGAGKGKLSELTYHDRTIPKINLKGYVIRPQARANTEDTLRAISSIAGERGSGAISKDMLASASGLKRTTADDAKKRLVNLGLIDVEYVIDPIEASRGRKVQVMSDKRINTLVRKGVISRPDFSSPYVNFDIDESPVYTIRKPEHITTEGPAKPLSSLPALSSPGERVVRTSEGAARYGVSIGQPIPEEG